MFVFICPFQVLWKKKLRYIKFDVIVFVGACIRIAVTNACTFYNYIILYT